MVNQIQFLDDGGVKKMLFDTNKIAFHEDCCCGCQYCGGSGTPSTWEVTISDIIICDTCVDIGAGQYFIHSMNTGNYNGVFTLEQTADKCVWEITVQGYEVEENFYDGAPEPCAGITPATTTHTGTYHIVLQRTITNWKLTADHIGTCVEEPDSTGLTIPIFTDTIGISADDCMENQSFTNDITFCVPILGCGATGRTGHEGSVTAVPSA